MEITRYFVYDQNLFKYLKLKVPAYIDSLTLRYHLFHSLQMHELGTFRVGSESDPIGVIIPPNQDSFKITSVCSNDCIRTHLAGDGAVVTVVEALPLANSAGQQVTTRILRNNIAVGYLGRNRFFNHSFQQSFGIYPGIGLGQNDSLLTECFYSTSSKKRFTFGGLGMDDETCQQVFLYYPRSSAFKYCESFVDVYSQYELFRHIKNFGHLTNYLETQTKNFTTKSYKWILNKLYNEYEALMNMRDVPYSFVSKLKQLYDNSPYYSECQPNATNRSSYPIMFSTESATTVADECKFKEGSDSKNEVKLGVVSSTGSIKPTLRGFVAVVIGVILNAFIESHYFIFE